VLYPLGSVRSVSFGVFTVRTLEGGDPDTIETIVLQYLTYSVPDAVDVMNAWIKGTAFVVELNNQLAHCFPRNI